MLVQEASQMAEWYLQQQQELDQAAADSGSSSSRRGGCAAVAPRGVATIIAGDFNATPNSPMYTFLSKGCIDLHKVS
jgi:endonuclease/exonuclease/phosphatase family metal-dependent hydrolase